MVATIPELEKNNGLVEGEAFSLQTFDHATRNIFGTDEETGEGLLMKVMTEIGKVAIDAENKRLQSTQGVNLGRKVHPFDMTAIKRLKHFNVHHSTCINTKVAATVGLGFVTDEDKEKRAKEEAERNAPPPAPVAVAPGAPPAPPPLPPAPPAKKENRIKNAKADKVLNPLCTVSFAELLNDVAEDYFQVGNGYIEVVHNNTNKRSEITGLHHIPAEMVFMHIEDQAYTHHYVIESTEASVSGAPRRFARFGDLDDFLKRAGSSGSLSPFEIPTEINDTISEVIHFRQPTSSSRWYGMPNWLAAVPLIELVQCMIQQRFDFFLNRGVPEFMLFLLGTLLKKEDKKKLDDALKATIGLGNQHKSFYMNINDPDMKVQLEKLIAEGSKEDDFDKALLSMSLGTVSAHQVPPLLAGIVIPGKMGANNELPNALMAFQLLVAAQAQRQFVQVLGDSLGSDKAKGIELDPEDFEFNTIVDWINIGEMDTMSRMRQPVATAQAQGRQLSAGVKD